MRIRLALVGAVATMALAATGTAIAGGHTSPGTPGDKNCHGQTMAYLNEIYGTVFDVHGIGNISDFTGLSVQEIQDIVDAYCAS